MLLPEGKLDLPFALQPWPAEIDAKPGDGFSCRALSRGRCLLDDLRAMSTVTSLVRRLFESAHAPFNLQRVAAGSRTAFHHRCRHCG